MGEGVGSFVVDEIEGKFSFKLARIKYSYEVVLGCWSLGKLVPPRYARKQIPCAKHRAPLYSGMVRRNQ